MSMEYLDAIETADTAIGIILNELERANLSDCYNIILHSDHGGINNHHLENIPEVMTIPWIAVGPGVRQNYIIGVVSEEIYLRVKVVAQLVFNWQYPLN